MKGLWEVWGEGQPSALAQLMQARRDAGEPLYDLISAAPDAHGLVFPPNRFQDIVAQAAASPTVGRYAPDSFGQGEAREAVASQHRADEPVSADHVALVPGTSFAYWAAFRLLRAGGADCVLCPWPTYPLFEDLATLACVHVRRWHMDRTASGRWTMDAGEIEFQITPATRAILVVAPHNPTGMIPTEEEWSALSKVARRHRLPVIVDCVYRNFRDSGMRDVLPDARLFPLLITLNGVSKSLCLPGVKAGWMVMEGDGDEVKRWCAALEYLLDSMLPVSELTQAMLPNLLRERDVAQWLAGTARARVHEWCRAAREVGGDVDLPEGGVLLTWWQNRDGEECAERLVKERGLVVHPGDFYGLPRRSIVSSAIVRVSDAERIEWSRDLVGQW